VTSVSYSAKSYDPRDGSMAAHVKSARSRCTPSSASLLHSKARSATDAASLPSWMCVDSRTMSASASADGARGRRRAPNLWEVAVSCVVGARVGRRSGRARAVAAAGGEREHGPEA
jgi:hypothetical protein